MIEEEANETRRALLRAFLLDTLPDSDRERIERHIASSDGQQELARERQLLALLDTAAPIAAPAGLAQRTAQRVFGRQSKARPQIRSHWPEWVVGFVLLAVIIGVFAPALSRAREAARRSSCQNNLKQMGIVFKMYTQESLHGLYPPVGLYDGIWMFDIRAIYPEYLSDLTVLIDPSHPDADGLAQQMHDATRTEPIDYNAIARVASQSYTYLGWVMSSDDDVTEVKRALRAGDADLLKGIELDGNRGLRRLQEGIDDSPSIPVMFDTITPEIRTHSPAGANVLFFDGHVDFIKQGERFPVLPSTQALLAPE